MAINKLLMLLLIDSLLLKWICAVVGRLTYNEFLLVKAGNLVLFGMIIN